jgi:quercetin dioxygenase-like cupin family protein
MTIRNTENISRASVGARLWKRSRYIIGLALVAWAAAHLITAKTAVAHANAHMQLNAGFSHTPLSMGTDGDRQFVVEQQGPSDVYQMLLTWAPGGDTGWHTHPGPVIFVIQSGSLLEHRSNGCDRTLSEGTVIIEPAGVLHDVINQTGATVQAYVTFLTPHGVPFFSPADPPAPQPCKQ